MLLFVGHSNGRISNLFSKESCGFILVKMKPVINLLLFASCTTALAPATGTKPHIIMHLADDFGWANAGWHRAPGFDEVQTPNMNHLVQCGIELDQA